MLHSTCYAGATHRTCADSKAPQHDGVPLQVCDILWVSWYSISTVENHLSTLHYLLPYSTCYAIICHLPHTDTRWDARACPDCCSPDVAWNPIWSTSTGIQAPPTAIMWWDNHLLCTS